MRDVNCDFDWILGLVVRGGRARAGGGSALLVVRERYLALPGISGIWQRLSGSATQHYQVYLGYGSGCPGAQPSITRYIWDMAVVVRERNHAG